MKNILITGAARGLGKHIADYLAAKGYSVYGTTSRISNTETLSTKSLLYLDYTDKRSIIELAKHFTQSGIQIHGVIHNSGIAYLDPVDVLLEKEHRDIFDINYFGPIELTKRLLPSLKRNRSSHLVFISSITSLECYLYLGAYSASKRAVEAIAFEWACLLNIYNINVSVVQPNPLPTNMDIMRSKNTESNLYPDLVDRSLKWESIQDTVNLILQILENPKPKFLYHTGEFSQQSAERLCNLTAQQNLLKEYQEQFTKLSKG